jgi:hypothetical protein
MCLFGELTAHNFSVYLFNHQFNNQSSSLAFTVKLKDNCVKNLARFVGRNNFGWKSTKYIV